jgi:hypothetical protein
MRYISIDSGGLLLIGPDLLLFQVHVYEWVLELNLKKK